MKCELNHLELYQALVSLRGLVRYAGNKVFLIFSKDGLKVAAGSPSIVFAKKSIRVSNFKGEGLNASVDYAKLRSFLDYAHSDTTAVISGEKRLTVKIGQSRVTLAVEVAYSKIADDTEVDVIAPLTYDDVRLLASASECAAKVGNMQGLYIAYEGKNVTASSCDGYRMSFVWIESITPLKKGRLYLPATALKIVAELADQNMRIDMGTSGNLVAFVVGDWTITSVQMSGAEEYPMPHIYEMVQGSDAAVAQVHKAELMDALKTLGAVRYKSKDAGEVNRINFQFFNDQLFLTAKDGPDEMMIPLSSNGSDMEFGLSGSFARDGVSMFNHLDSDSDYVKFSMIDITNLSAAHPLIKMKTETAPIIYVMAVQLEV